MKWLKTLKQAAFENISGKTRKTSVNFPFSPLPRTFSALPKTEIVILAKFKFATCFQIGLDQNFVV